MTPQNDDARPIPRRPPSGAPAHIEWDDAWTVDTRGGRPRPGGGATPDHEPSPARPPLPRRPPVSRPDPPPVSRPDPPPVSGPGPPPVSRPPVRRRRRRLVILAVVLALLAYLGFELYAPIDAWNGVRRVADAPAGPRPAQGDGHTYLLVGSDSRVGMTTQQEQRLGTGGTNVAQGARTDSIILVHIPSGSGKAVMISVPRDSYVPIPGHGKNKINASFAIGGPMLLIATLEQTTGLRIDGYLEIGFGGFAALVDSVGGVDICVPFNMNDPKANINLKKGCQVLNGPNALGYVRARYSDPRGDIGREERQRQFLSAIMKKMATPATVLLPWTWWPTTHAAVAGVTVGQETSLSDAYRIVQTMRSLSSGKALSLVVPLASISYQTPDGDAVKWDTARALALFRMLNDGTPIDVPPAGTNGVPSGRIG